MAYFEGEIKEEDGKLAHQLFLPFVKEQAEKNGWKTKRYKTNQDGCDELILCGEGFFKNDEIFIGLKTFQDEDGDIYNLLSATRTQVILIINQVRHSKPFPPTTGIFGIL